ncbi:MAG: carboxypeptidase-like regulatory domain-containing protein [Dehalococcoidales bacterium]
MIKGIGLLAVIFALSLSATALAAENGAGTVEGQLVNGTANGSSVAAQDVTLKTYRNGNETSSAMAVTDADGRFSFDGLLTEPEYSYQVSLFYQEAQYFGDPGSFLNNENVRSTDITVYDSTNDDSAIVIATAHTIIYTAEDRISVTEYYMFVNDSDRTYIGSQEINDEGTKETLSFSLPAEYTDLQPTLGLMDCCIFDSEEGFIDTMAVIPGMKEISYSYSVETGSGNYALPLKINYPLVNYDLFIQGSAVKVSVDHLTAEEPMPIDGVHYSHFSGENLQADNTLTVRLSGLPQARGKNAVLWVVLSLVILGGSFGIGYSIRRKKVQPVSSEDNIQSVQQGLLLKLAELDDDFESGIIQENAYRLQRDETKNQLLRLI